MSTPAATYSIVSRIHTAQWDSQRQQAIPGWEIKARWDKTGTILDVFVPDANYGAEQVDQAIRYAGALDDQIAALGR
ncbi:MAG: hypothetical protein KGL35_11415 [Bradyrhizobium sp.]|nr:hypothetical protein [Bradyrhizobium sp.]